MKRDVSDVDCYNRSLRIVWLEKPLQRIDIDEYGERCLMLILWDIGTELDPIWIVLSFVSRFALSNFFVELDISHHFCGFGNGTRNDPLSHKLIDSS